MSLIVADVGGTNARLAFQKNINDEISLIENFLCSDFKTLEDIITVYKQKHNIVNEHISIGVAGPCEDDDIVLSNNHIKFNKIQLLKNLNLKSLLVINDFVAQSFAFKDLLLEENEEKSKILLETLSLNKIKHGTSRNISTLLVTGPGTGLGVCTLKKIGNNVIPIPGEGGNACFSPNNFEQIEILAHLLKSHKYVSFEDVVSGIVNDDNYHIIHGDPSFSNTLVDKDNQIWLIDPRGSFGNTKIYGDRRYDWAKFYYSAVGNYDSMNSKKFKVTIGDIPDVELEIDSNGYEEYGDIIIERSGMSKREMDLIHASLWLSLTGYVKEDVEAALFSFYMGTYLWSTRAIT